MPQTNINIRMDENLKQEFDTVCAESEIILASERALAKDWLLPEEDEAWANL